MLDYHKWAECHTEYSTPSLWKSSWLRAFSELARRKILESCDLSEKDNESRNLMYILTLFALWETLSWNLGIWDMLSQVTCEISSRLIETLCRKEICRILPSWGAPTHHVTQGDKSFILSVMQEGFPSWISTSSLPPISLCFSTISLWLSPNSLWLSTISLCYSTVSLCFSTICFRLFCCIFRSLGFRCSRLRCLFSQFWCVSTKTLGLPFYPLFSLFMIPTAISHGIQSSLHQST